MSSKKSQAFTEAIVGLFMVAVILLLAYFTIVISGVDILRGNSKTTIRIVFAQVGGLKNHDSVMYRGTKVGTIEYVEVTPSNLMVSASIDRNVVLRSGYKAKVCNLSMLGGYYLLLEEGDGEKLPLDQRVFNGETPTDWMRDVSDIARNIRAVTEMKEIRIAITNINAAVARCRQIAERADAISDRIARGEGIVGKLLSTDESVYNDARETIANAKVFMAGANESMGEMKSMMGDVKVTMANAKDISTKLNRDQTFADLEAGIAAFRKAAEGCDTKALTERATQLADNLNAVAIRLRDGEGTLGKLATDREMYDQLNALIKDCRQIIDNYRDTTPIATFSSLATGAL